MLSIVKFTDLIAFFQVTAGKTVIQILSWMNGLPGGDKNIFIVIQDGIVMQADTFSRDQTLAVQRDLFHAGFLVCCVNCRNIQKILVHKDIFIESLLLVSWKVNHSRHKFFTI